MHEIFNLENIYRAYLDCRKNKRKTVNALKFERNLEKNLFLLEKQLLDKTYRPGRSIVFIVTSPKPREVFAASFRDRIVHHLLIREIEKMGEATLIYDTFACRKNKGTHLAIVRLKKFMLKISQNYNQKTYYAQLDINSFFTSIDHDVLYSLFKKLISNKKKSIRWKQDILWLANLIIYHKPTENYVVKGDKSLFSLIPDHKSLFCAENKKGLPIGNYSSQFLANLYLNELDQFIKRKLKVRGYIRYVDDFILLSQSKEQLIQWRNQIKSFLAEKLKMRLNPKKTRIQPISAGIDFLGYFIKPDHVLVRRKVVKRLKGRIKEKPSENKSLATSYFGHFIHANSFNLRKKLLNTRIILGHIY